MTQIKTTKEPEEKKSSSIKKEKQTTEVEVPELSHKALTALVIENNTKINEIYRMVRHIRTMYTIKFMVTILLIVLPILGAYFILPRLVNNMVSTFSASMGGPAVELDDTDIFSMFSKLLGAESKQINEITNSAHSSQ